MAVQIWNVVMSLLIMQPVLRAPSDRQMCLGTNSSPVNSCQFQVTSTERKWIEKKKPGGWRWWATKAGASWILEFHFICIFHVCLFIFFLEGAGVRLLFASSGDEAGGGHRFVLPVTLITPWGTSVVPFPSCSVLISPLPADSSALITVFMLTYVTESKNTVFLGG